MMSSPSLLIEKFNITLTQRQATLTVMALYFLGAVLMTLIELIAPTVNAATFFAGGLGGAILFGGTWILYYKRSWEPARYFATVAFAVLVAFFLPEPFISDYAPMVVVLPLILAHILTNSLWVIINAFLTIGILLIRAGGNGVYSNPSTLTLYAMIGGGLLIKRLIEITSVREVKQAKEEIKQSEIRFRSLIENGSDEICILDTNGTLLYESPSSSPTLGYHPLEFLGRNFFQLVHPEDFKRVQSLFTDLVENSIVHPRVQFRILHNNGTWRWIEGVATNLLHEPSVHGIVVNYHDVTERVESEGLIQSQLKRLSGLRQIDIAIGSSFDLNITLGIVLQQVSSLLNVDACTVLLIDPEFRRVEHAASRGFRSTSNELPYANLQFAGGYAQQVILERRIIHISSNAETSDKPVQAPRRGDEVFVDYYGAPLMVKGEVKGILEIYHRSSLQTDCQWLEFLEMLAGQAAIAIDNAQLFSSLQTANAELERRVAERTAELNKTNAELERANRTKDEFLANMSHELRTPLNSILGLSESLLEQKRGLLNDNQEKSLQIIASSGNHLLELINDVLDLSKIEAKMFDFYPQPILIDDLCRSCLAFVRAQAAKKSINLTYIPEPFVTKIFADPRRLKQILVNLLINAVKFTPKNDNIILQVKADSEQDLIQFSVIDNGIGIAAEDLKRLFQPFVQVDSSLSRQYEGTGLGLSLVQKLTDLHGGSVNVESTIGTGSSFTINLPCKLDEITKLENIRRDFDLSALDNARKTHVPLEKAKNFGTILLAEDNMSNILMLSEYLEGQGYEVVVAHDGLEAIEKAEANNPDFILMDIQMPALNGLDAIARLRRNPIFIHTPIIALTALAMPGDRERCILAGATEYMSKPISLKSLKLTIENLLEAQPVA